MEEEKIYAELKQLRSVLSMVVETQDLPKTEQFLKEAKKKAATEYRNLQSERGEWIPGDEISKIIRSALYGAGKFIIGDSSSKITFHDENDTISTGKIWRHLTRS